jgi:histidine triad (HIT) family protein
MKDCIFCKIVSKEIPADIVYEDEHFLAFLDVNPVHKGHLLLVPKEHHVWMQDTPDETVGEIFILTKKLMVAMQQGINAGYVQIGVVGTEIPHFHIHLIPHSLDDKTPQTFRHYEPYENQEEQHLFAEKIRNVI